MAVTFRTTAVASEGTPARDVTVTLIDWPAPSGEPVLSVPLHWASPPVRLEGLPSVDNKRHTSWLTAEQQERYWPRIDANQKLRTILQDLERREILSDERAEGGTQMGNEMCGKGA
jgi:hypothetical protein